MIKTFFVTKHALTEGIKEKALSVDDDGMYARQVNGSWSSFRIGRDCFADLNDAIKNADQRRAKKIASLEKQLAKLRAIEFA